MIHRVNQRIDHLFDGNETEPHGGGGGQWKRFGEFVERQEYQRPAMSRSQDVPGPEDRRGKACIRNQRFARRSHRKISAHHRRRLRHAHVHKVGGNMAASGCHGGANGDQIDLLKLPRLRGAGMGVPTR